MDKEFFEPSDFKLHYGIDNCGLQAIADTANAKLKSSSVEIHWVDGVRKAVILPKQECKHPPEKIRFEVLRTFGGCLCICECGAWIYRTIN